MGRSWIISIVSSASFLVAALVAVTLGAAQEPPQVSGVGQVVSPEATKFGNLSRGDFGLGPSVSQSAQASPTYQPPEQVYLAHPSNYGERYKVDVNGLPADNDYIVVLHETVGSASSAINTFQTNHPNDNDQVSYHTLIGADGTVIYVVPPEQRAFGAGNSVFSAGQGDESVVTNSAFPSSVNNFAYHISLETPPDGQNNDALGHSGYTEAQYQSLAWLLARTTVPKSRITTHKAVDRSGSRIDPRSFEMERLFILLDSYPGRAELS